MSSSGENYLCQGVDGDVTNLSGIPQIVHCWSSVNTHCVNFHCLTIQNCCCIYVILYRLCLLRTPTTTPLVETVIARRRHGTTKKRHCVSYVKTPRLPGCCCRVATPASVPSASRVSAAVPCVAAPSALTSISSRARRMFPKT